MTSRADWLTRTFRGLFESANRASVLRKARSAPPRLEALEDRKLLAHGSEFWSFATASFHPMKVNVLTLKPGASQNPIFVAPYDQSPDPSRLVGQDGPLIMDSQGNPIWFKPISNNNSKQVFDFNTETLRGKPVLIWWQGTIAGIAPSNLPPGSVLTGQFVIYNQHYKPIMTVKAPNKVGLDLHELQITNQGNAYFFTTKVVKANLSAYGGPANGSYVDAILQEINLRTGKPLFTWDMAKHVPLADSYIPAPTNPGQPWDVYHVNSIDVSPDGSQILVSARSTWGVYDIQRRGGGILWQIGGKHNQFAIPPSLVTGPDGSAFQYQHDARFTAGGISLFDDAGLAAPPNGGPFGPSRVLNLNLDVANHRAGLASPVIYHTPALYANSQGNSQNLGNGNMFVGWGSDSAPGQLSSYYSQYAADGTVLSDYVLAGQDISYRAFSQPWVGMPLTKPSAAVLNVNGQQTVFASWNGSTQTVSWELLAGSSRGRMSPVSVTTRSGFETAITTTAAGPYYEVKAINEAGQVIGTSQVVR